jgi:ferric-dicitrate binding protein FerR (iron transport regulator)
MPSQKVVISDDTKDLEITNVNIQKYIAWKEEVLIFENDNFESIVKILERHYNVKIINNFRNINIFKYNGIFKNDSIEKILNTIKIHTNFSFEREGDTIIIINPKNI